MATTARVIENSLFAVRVAPDGSFRYDGINPAHEARTGLRQAAISGQRPEDVLPTEAAAKVIRRHRECVETGRTINAIRPRPAIRRSNWRTSTSVDWRRIEMLLGSCEDVTDQVAAQTALAESEERFRLVTTRAGDLHGFLDGAGPDRLSPAFFAYTGIPETTNGREALKTVHPDDRDRLTPNIQLARRQLYREPGADPPSRRRHRWFLLRLAVAAKTGDKPSESPPT